MQRELGRFGSNLLGTITFAGKECDPLMLADFLASGTFQMELAGRNEPPTGGSYSVADRDKTIITSLKFKAGEMAAWKAKLVKTIEDRAAWGNRAGDTRSNGKLIT